VPARLVRLEPEGCGDVVLGAVNPFILRLTVNTECLRGSAPRPGRERSMLVVNFEARGDEVQSDLLLRWRLVV